MSKVLYLQHLAGQPVQQVENTMVSLLREQLNNRNEAIEILEKEVLLYKSRAKFIAFSMPFLGFFLGFLWGMFARGLI